MLHEGGGGVRFTIWYQTSRAFYAVENREKLMFQATLLKTIIIKVVLFFQVLIFDSKLDILPKTYQGGTIILKSPLKLLITSSYNEQQLVFLENQIIF